MAAEGRGQRKVVMLLPQREIASVFDSLVQDPGGWCYQSARPMPNSRGVAYALR